MNFSIIFDSSLFTASPITVRGFNAPFLRTLVTRLTLKKWFIDVDLYLWLRPNAATPLNLLF